MITRDAELLTRDEAEQLLDLPKNYLDNLARPRTGPAFFKFSTRVVRYTRTELLRWRDAQLVMAQT
jgi:hypothetical protein